MLSEDLNVYVGSAQLCGMFPPKIIKNSIDDGPWPLLHEVNGVTMLPRGSSVYLWAGWRGDTFLSIGELS